MWLEQENGQLLEEEVGQLRSWNAHKFMLGDYTTIDSLEEENGQNYKIRRRKWTEIQKVVFCFNIGIGCCVSCFIYWK